MTKGYVIRLNELNTKKELVIQLFNGQRWKLKGEHAIRFSTFYQEGKPYEVAFLEGRTADVFDQIKLVFDQKGRVIAQRIAHDSPLITIRRNDIFKYTQKDPKQAALGIYNQLETQQDQEFGAEMASYWYSTKYNKLVKK